MLDIFDLLGSQTRRKILQLLGDEPSYLSEISKVLGVGHKALISHLSSLEKFGILKSYAKEVKKAPSRKYYEISKDTCLWVRISSKGYQTEVYDPKRRHEKVDQQRFSKISEQFNHVNKEMQKLNSYTDPIEKLSAMNDITSTLNKLKNDLMSSLYYVENNNLALQQYIDDTLKEQFKPDEATVLSSLFMQAETLDELAEQTRMNPYHIMYILNDFEKRGIVQKKDDRWVISEKYLKESKKAKNEV